MHCVHNINQIGRDKERERLRIRATKEHNWVTLNKHDNAN